MADKASRPGTRTTGRYENSSVAGETVGAFVPHPLPPSRPKLSIEGDLAESLDSAETAVSQLESTTQLVPSVDWFVYSLVRKEAVISSQIEGTQASLADLLAVEADAPTDAPADHVEEIFNYLEAFEYARTQLRRSKGLPLSTRLLNGMHKRLLSGVRGQDRQPGRIRSTQNWLGGTRPGNAAFVPPPPHRVKELMGDLELFLHEESGLSPLLRAGLVHAQFETIHPYLDGNGRVGRLLIALCLEEWELLSEPLLYLSAFFKQHQREYYARLSAIRTDGDWEGWLAFFLEGVTVVANEATALIRVLFSLIESDRKRYLASEEASIVGSRLMELLPQHPLVTVKSAARLSDTTSPTASKAIRSLIEAGILEETSGRRRDRTFEYTGYLDLLSPGTEL